MTTIASIGGTPVEDTTTVCGLMDDIRAKFAEFSYIGQHEADNHKLAPMRARLAEFLIELEVIDDDVQGFLCDLDNA